MLTYFELQFTNGAAAQQIPTRWLCINLVVKRPGPRTAMLDQTYVLTETIVEPSAVIALPR